MSVLNQSGEEQVECPLCMEPLEVDDLNFYPCTCGYQICRFCWHRIRTDENGLCPACRKAYSENPADFTPLSKEQVAQLKAEKRQRDQQKKAKLTESRKHLASVRVVQRNLVFVVGLPMRLADPEILKKYEYFGKFGKIHKVVINQSTAYAGTQGPSASAYVTYLKSDDALRAIQNVNNTIMDGKTIKTSLGTTKYCSHFMKNQPCPKPDCMYLHDFGDQEASFTKEQMHAGKHQEYEKKLHDALLSKQAATAQHQQNNNHTCPNIQQNGTTNGTCTPQPTSAATSTSTSSTLSITVTSSANTTASNSGSSSPKNKENWPQLNNDGSTKCEGKKAEKDSKRGKKKASAERKEKKSTSQSNGGSVTTNNPVESDSPTDDIGNISPPTSDEPPTSKTSPVLPQMTTAVGMSSIIDDNSSFYSQSFAKLSDANESNGSGSSHSPSTPLLPHSEPLLELHTDNWDLNFGQSKYSNHLEELALSKQRNAAAAALGSTNGILPQQHQLHHPKDHLDFSDLLAPLDNQYNNTEDLLATLAKNGMNYVQNGSNNYNGHKDMMLDQNVSKLFNSIYKNAYSPSYSTMNGYHHSENKFSFMSQQQPQPPHQLHHSELEEQLLHLTLGNKLSSNYNQQPQQQMNGQYEMNLQNGLFGSHHHQQQINSLFGGSSAISSNKVAANSNSRTVLDDKDMDYRFLETQKALEELVESDNHMHNSARNLGQMNGLSHSQSSNHLNHLPPPPPGFVQPQTTHMNSFGSKILPFLNMNSQQQHQQQQQQINAQQPQNNWPSSYSSLQQQQQQNQHKVGMGVCNDWKILDPAILSSRRHLSDMTPLLDQYTAHHQQPHAQQVSSGLGGAGNTSPFAPPQSYMTGGGGPFTNFAPLQQQPQQNFNAFTSYHHANGISSANNAGTTSAYHHWLQSDLNSQISSPPGFRSTGQATKQQEC